MNEANRVTEKSELAQLIIDGDAAGRLIPIVLDFEYKDRKRELASFLADLHNSGEIALLSDANLEAIRRLERSEFWMIFGVLSDAIEHVVDDYPAVQQFAECLVERAGDDGLLAHRLYHSSVGAKTTLTSQKNCSRRKRGPRGLPTLLHLCLARPQ